ncbi:MAG: DegT/DnrJ/EryC1/StrS family aminotransferase [Sulfuricellaceae bacterium]
MYKIRYRNLSVSDPQFKAELLAAVDRVLTHGIFILGTEVEEFEQLIAKYCQRQYCVGMNSGTDALFFAIKAMNIGAGDEVITTPMSWVATANAIVVNGATPVFVDVADDLNINPDLIEAAITKYTKAIVPVHFTGRLCKMDKILAIAERHGIPVIEDAAQAFGAYCDEGVAGSFGKLSCFSMNPMKGLCAYGEAGVVVTDDPILQEKMRSLRYAGTVNREDCHIPSLNGRIDTIQAAMMIVGLRHFTKKMERLHQIAAYYFKNLKEIVTCPLNDGSYHAFYSYTIVTDKRDDLKDYLASCGVETKIQHSLLIPYHTAYRGRFDIKIPTAERLVKQILCIPSHEHLSDEDVAYITQCIKDFFA